MTSVTKKNRRVPTRPVHQEPSGHGYGDLLTRFPAFRDLWLGQAISQLGDSLYYLVFLFMVERLTGDPAMVGIAGVAQSLPFLLLSPYAGVVADRFDRRRILLACDLLSAAALLASGVYIWFDRTPPTWTLIFAGAVLSSINTFFAPAKGAAIPQIVPEAHRPTANALSLATQNVMPMVGMALSGTALAALYAISPTYFFLSSIGLNALSFLLSAYFIARVKALVPTREVAEESESGVRRALRDAIEGFRFVREQQVLWILLWVSVLIQVSLAPFMLIYVQVNKEWFGGGYGTLALCETTFFLGVVGMSAVFGRLKVRRPGLAYIGGTAVIGVAIILMAFTRTLIPFAWWNFVAGVAFPFMQIPMTGYIQHRVPEAFQGRVNAALTMAGMGIAPLGIGLGGLLLAKIGPAGMLAVMGAGTVLAGVVGLADRTFRDTHDAAID